MSCENPMRESDAPPPGDPSMRGSRVWGLVIIAVLVIFFVWFAADNWRVRGPGRNNTEIPVQGGGGERP